MFNKVLLMGRLTADPELRQTTNGVSVCKFRIAVNRPYQKDGERQSDFINIVAWRQTAEFVSRYFSKGKMIIVDGSMRNNDYTDNNGVKHFGMEVYAENVTFGEAKSATENSGNFSVPQQQSAPPQYGNQQQYSQPSPPPANDSFQIGNLNDFEEILSDGEVPF